MTDGLRQRKRARTRAHIAATAARLFAQRGYERTAIAEIARAAEVSEQTVYNYFPVKEDLVVDRDEEVRTRFVAAVRDRPAGMGPAAAIRPVALALVEDIAQASTEELRGSLGPLAALSPAIHRLVLESTDTLASSLAAVLLSTSAPPPPPAWAKVMGVAHAWVSQLIIDETGRLVGQDAEPREVAAGVRVAVTEVLDRLDACWARRTKGATTPSAPATDLR